MQRGWQKLNTQAEGKKLLSIIAKDYKLVRKGNYYTTEEHDSLIIDPQKGVFFWNSKGIVGDVFVWLKEIKGKGYNESIQEIISTPDDFRYDVFEVQPVDPNPALVAIYYQYGEEYRDYWLNYRGYDLNSIAKFQLGYTGKYWVIPIFVGGVFTNFQCRGFDDNGHKIVRNFYQGTGNLPFNFDVLPEDYDRPIFITESPVDCIMLSQHGLTAISCTSGASSWDHEWSKRLFNYRKVYICYDNDEAGRKGAMRTSTHLKHNSFILEWPKDSFPEKFDMTDLYKSGKDVMHLLPYFYPSYIYK